MYSAGKRKEKEKMRNSLGKIGVLGAALAALSVFAEEVRVDFNAVTGPVKPVNGVGQPPMLRPSKKSMKGIAIIVSNNL